MPADEFRQTFDGLKSVLAENTDGLKVQTDKPDDYCLHTQKPSPFPQHKGHGLYFAEVKIGKAYVSLHILPLYMNPPLVRLIPPELKKRMQGKACFNFKTPPDEQTQAQLRDLLAACLDDWRRKDWL